MKKCDRCGEYKKVRKEKSIHPSCTGLKRHEVVCYSYVCKDCDRKREKDANGGLDE